MNILYKAFNSLNKNENQNYTEYTVKPKILDDELSQNITPIIDLKLNDIHYVKLIGSGTFGKVYSGYIKDKSNSVAIKKIKIDNNYINRELEIMQLLSTYKNSNILNLITYKYSKNNLYLITKIIPIDLKSLIIKSFNDKNILTKDIISNYTYQIISGLHLLHSLSICHRDLKPENILINPNIQNVKLCDFGSSKIINNNTNNNTTYISTRYYRAPECILENINYTISIDIWSFGCIFAELLKGDILFPGSDNTDQLFLIFRNLGFPTSHDLYDINPELDPFITVKKKKNFISWDLILNNQNLDYNIIDILNFTLKINFKYRITTDKLLKHNYFNQYRLYS
tara:strand:- start:2592 stop:3614 length:1023 start_codon:yes stop_codon:yes gene_type:complete